MDLEQLNKAFDTIAPHEYVRADDTNSFTLDGHFSLEQLKSIVNTIELFRGLKPTRDTNINAKGW